MSAARMKTWALVVGTGAAAIAGTWAYMASAMKPAVAEIASTGCGVPSGAPTLAVPLALLAESARGVPVGVGPLDTGALAAPLRIVFDPALSPAGRELAMTGDTLALPTTYGRTGMVPERINLTCRDGEVTTVRYAGGRSGATSFNVTVVEAEVAAADPAQEMLPDGEPAAEPLEN